MKSPCVYMLTNRPNGILYIGVTSDLPSRMNQHTQSLINGFTKRHGIRAAGARPGNVAQAEVGVGPVPSTG